MLRYRCFCLLFVVVAASMATLCIALCTGPVSAQPAAVQPGFDCTRASTAIEKTICADKTLAMLDREMTRVLTLAREDASISQPNILKDQDTWLKQRNECLSSTD